MQQFSENYDARIVAKLQNCDLASLRNFAEKVNLESYHDNIANFDKVSLIEALSNLDLPPGIIAKVYQKLEIDGDEESFTKLSADEIEKIF